MALKSTSLTSTATSILPDSNGRAITVIYFHNTHSSAVTVDIYAVPAGDTAGVANKIYGLVSINVNDTLILDGTEKMILDNGDKIQCTCSVDNVVFAICSYAEF